MFTISVQTDALDHVLDDFVKSTPKFCEKHKVDFEEKKNEACEILKQCDYDRWLAFASVWRSMAKSAKTLDNPADLYNHLSCLIGCLESAYRDHKSMESLFDE